MSGQPLDVLLRVRMRYEAQGGARQAVGDLDQIKTKATALGSIDAGSRLTRELRDVGTAAGRTGREIAELGNSAARLGQGAGPSRLQAELKRLADPAKTAHREVVELGTAVRRLGDGRGPRELERELESAGRRADDVRRRVAAIGAPHAGRSGERHRFTFGNEALAASGAAGALRFGMSGAAVAGVGAGAAIGGVAAGLAAASRNAIEFETSLTEVRKALNETPEGIRALERDILKFSRASGVAKTEIAGLVAQAGYLNVPRDKLQEFAEIAVKSSVAFRMPAGETGKSLGELRNAYNIQSGSDLRLAADAINTIGDTAGTSERNVLNFLNRVSGPAQLYKMPLPKAAAFGGSVMGLGVEPDVAATSFNALMNRFGTADHQNKDFQRGLRGIGLNSRRVKKMMQADPAEALMDVLGRINSLSAEKKPGVIDDLAGAEYGPGVARMAESLAKVREALERVKAASAYSGSLERTFKIFSSDTQAQINRTAQAYDNLKTKLGQYVSPAINEAARYMERLLNGTVKFLERGERAEALAKKLAGGTPLTSREQAEVEADPLLKDDLDKSLYFKRRKLEFEENRKKAETDPGSLPTQDQAREAWEKKAREWEERRQRAKTPEALPGTGKRSALSDDARVSLASYTQEVETSLDRTERIVRDSTRRMREDLAIKARVDIGADRFGSSGGARIETAAYGGGGLGGAGGGMSLSPGRFGIPRPGGGGGGGGGSARTPSGRDRSRFGRAGGGGGGDAPRGSGEGTRGSPTRNLWRSPASCQSHGVISRSCLPAPECRPSSNQRRRPSKRLAAGNKTVAQADLADGVELRLRIGGPLPWHGFLGSQPVALIAGSEHERQLPPSRRALRLSRLDQDPELAAFVIDRLGKVPQTAIRTEAIQRFGIDRVPSATAMSRFAGQWKAGAARVASTPLEVQPGIGPRTAPTDDI